MVLEYKIENITFFLAVKVKCPLITPPTMSDQGCTASATTGVVAWIQPELPASVWSPAYQRRS